MTQKYTWTVRNVRQGLHFIDDSIVIIYIYEVLILLSAHSNGLWVSGNKTECFCLPLSIDEVRIGDGDIHRFIDNDESVKSLIILPRESEVI